MMRDVQITISLSEELVKQASALGMLSNEYIETLIRADIQKQLEAMADDLAIQKEIRQIHAEFSVAEGDGLDQNEAW